MNSPDLDIVIPVYNEGENMGDILRAFQKGIKTCFRVIVCYDFDEDNTLPVLGQFKNSGFEIMLVKNPGRGVHSAIMAGFQTASAPAVLMFPADEVYNTEIIDEMYEKFKKGNDVVVASRFTRGGSMKGGQFIKSSLVKIASFTLNKLAGIPATDATYGLRLFSKKILNTVKIESRAGFTYALELLVKCHRLRWNIAETPARWFEREKGQSRFDLKKWLPHYIRWYFYAFATSCLKRSPNTVKLKSNDSK